MEVLKDYLLVCYGLVTILFLFLGLVKWMKENRKKQVGVFSLKELTVIVPFRDEKARLPELLNTLQNQTALPAHYIFVNDHSTDAGVAFIAEELSKHTKLNYTILDLPEGRHGKKSAILFAMEWVKTEFFLLQDADVFMSVDYFENLRNLPNGDLIILPVEMVGYSIQQYFYSLDHFMINTINWMFSLLYPLTASGANLIVRKSSFMELTFDDYNEAVASGDDQFILHDFRKSKKKIFLEGSHKYLVKTQAPLSFIEFINQRLRWAGKTAKIGDVVELMVGGLGMILTFTFFSLIFYYLWIEDVQLALCLFMLKLVCDTLVYGCFFLYQKRPFYLLLLPIMQAIYPFYALLVTVLLPFYSPKWKGRAIYNATRETKKGTLK
ncbi:MAG: glycosyltransferase [Lishizhenia sp.]